METIHIIILSIIQGLTEFLPISSSAHLILPSEVLGWDDQGLAFDLAVHLGSLAAVIAYFRHDLRRMTLAWFGSFSGQAPSEDARLAWIVFYATLPAVVIGLVAIQFVDHMRSGLLIAANTIIFALLLGWADRKNHDGTLQTLSLKQGILIGLAQCLALIPGTSRSGITMTTALLLGLNREASARFSFLLSVPVIAAAVVLQFFSLLRDPMQVDWQPLIMGAVLAGIVSYLCIHYFLSWIARISFMPFVVYRLILGFVLLYFLL